MKNITVKKIVVILLIVLMLATITSTVYGYWSDGISQIEQGSQNANGTDQVYNIAGIILGIVKAVGISVAVIMIIVLAIRYLLASAEGKAEIKKYAMGYVFGAILLFGGVAILEIIEQFASGMTFV